MLLSAKLFLVAHLPVQNFSCACLLCPFCVIANNGFIYATVTPIYPNMRPVIIERMGVCMEQAIKIRNLLKTVGNLPGGADGRASSSFADTRACDELRAARKHARLVEQHAEILVLGLRSGPTHVHPSS